MVEEMPGYDRIQEVVTDCERIGCAVYNTLATERKRLKVITLEEWGTQHQVGENTKIVIPVIDKSFCPITPEGRANVVEICNAAKWVAELENKILSLCDDGEEIYETTPFKLRRISTTGGWNANFSVSVNSVKTPTFEELSKIYWAIPSELKAKGEKE